MFKLIYKDSDGMGYGVLAESFSFDEETYTLKYTASSNEYGWHIWSGVIQMLLVDGDKLV